MKIIVRTRSGMEYAGSIDTGDETLEAVSQNYYNQIVNCLQAVCFRIGPIIILWSEIESIRFEKEP